MDMTFISKRLETRFGLGTRPDLRRAFYHRLEAIVDEFGESAYRIISGAAVDAEGKTNPGRYFVSVVARRLEEQGVVKIPEL